MNLHEGVRRLGILLGVIGVGVGVFGSYLVLTETGYERSKHNEFERSANTDVVTREQKYLLSLHLSGDAIPLSTDVLNLPDGVVVDPWPVQVDMSTYQPIPAPPPGFIAQHAIGKSEQAPQTVLKNPVVTAESPKIIKWTRTLGIEEIERADGTVVFPTPQPSGWLYILALILPAIGFIVPWGAVRALTWVITGFTAKA